MHEELGEQTKGKARLLDLMLRAKAQLPLPLDLELHKKGKEVEGRPVVRIPNRGQRLSGAGQRGDECSALLPVLLSPCCGEGCRK